VNAIAFSEVVPGHGAGFTFEVDGRGIDGSQFETFDPGLERSDGPDSGPRG